MVGSILMGRKDDEYIKSVVDSVVMFLKENLYSKIIIADIVKRFSISKSVLESYFKSYTNCGVMKYFSVLRLKESEILLKTTNLSIADISFSLNFFSCSHFSKCFKKYFGMTPSEYRKNRSNCSKSDK